MITQSTPFSLSQLNTIIEAYYDGNSYSGTPQYVGIQASDLNFASLPSAILNSPRHTITQVSTTFTIPATFFGVHSTPGSLSQLGNAGAKSVRTRDQNVTWKSAISNKTQSISFSGNTATWSGHGLSSVNHGVYLWSSGGSVPSGLTAYIFYYIINVTTNTFQLSTSPNGTPITLASSGGGTIYAYGINRVTIDPLLGSLGVLNQIVSAASAAGMDVLFDCSEIPPVLSKDGTAYNIPTANTYVTNWVSFLYTMFGNTIAFYEVWNEPNTPGYFNGTTTGGGNDLWTYAAWIKAAIAATGGTAKVVSPSWTSSASAAMGTWLGTDGGNSQIDIVAFHPYRGGPT